MSESEQNILNAAEALFSNQGFDATSIKQIADQAGLSKSSIFHYFSNKDALYLAVIKRSCQGIQAMLNTLSQSANLDTISKLILYCAHDLQEMMNHADVVRLTLRELTYGREAHAQQLAQEAFSEQFLHLRALISEGQQCGLLRQDINAGHQAIALTGLNVFLFLTWPSLKYLPQGDFVEPFKSGETLCDLLLNGMRTAQ
ncbi:MAG: TetR/AcrR family transcriptional regulator [Zetaproteobacteria bacterium]|nr:TetR/AcrR family transcriptional regulator [Zetaproteobacteria bacterium]